ncbi:MAG: hypothetical protein ABH951_00845 [Patescibacteria group bacterium]
MLKVLAYPGENSFYQMIELINKVSFGTLKSLRDPIEICSKRYINFYNKDRFEYFSMAVSSLGEIKNKKVKSFIEQIFNHSFRKIYLEKEEEELVELYIAGIFYKQKLYGKKGEELKPEDALNKIEEILLQLRWTSAIKKIYDAIKELTKKDWGRNVILELEFELSDFKKRFHRKGLDILD